MADEETPEKDEPAPNQAVAVWQRLGSRQRVVIGVALAVMLAILGWAMTRDTSIAHGVLFSGLSPEDAGRIVQELQTRKVPYEVANGGTAITVPESQVHELRLTLSADGMSPVGGGVGFELFDKQAFGTTSFVERMNFRRALEGELSRTIMSLSTVDRARVHIAMGKRSLYTRESEPPSASVVMSLRAGQELTRVQRRGIVNMVASAVDGLDPARVTLVDGNGNALSSPDSDSVGPEGTMDLERTLAQRVERMLEAVVGSNNVAVTITAELDREIIERTEELYDQAPDKIALRSEERVVRGEGAAANVGGEAGARGNLPGTAAGGGGGAGAGPQHLSEMKNYEINKIVQRTVGPKQRVKRLHLAVLIDEQVDEEGNPIVRTPEELSRITAIAREAAGLDEERGDKIEVHSVPFVRDAVPELPEEEEVVPEEGIPLPYLAAAGAAALLMFIVFFAMLRRRRRKAAEQEAEEQDEEELPTTLPMTVSELEAELPGGAIEAEMLETAASALQELPEDATALDKATAVAAADTELASRVLRGWLADDSPAPSANEYHSAAANDEGYANQDQNEEEAA